MAVAYINLYQSGYYHRLGKPGQFNVHPGDMYPTREAAVEDAHPKELYLGTFPVLLGVFGTDLVPNPPDCCPTPLEVSRAAFEEWGCEGLRALADQQVGG